MRLFSPSTQALLSRGAKWHTLCFIYSWAQPHDLGLQVKFSARFCLEIRSQRYLPDIQTVLVKIVALLLFIPFSHFIHIHLSQTVQKVNFLIGLDCIEHTVHFIGLQVCWDILHPFCKWGLFCGHWGVNTCNFLASVKGCTDLSSTSCLVWVNGPVTSIGCWCHNTTISYGYPNNINLWNCIQTSMSWCHYCSNHCCSCCQCQLLRQQLRWWIGGLFGVWLEFGFNITLAG